MISEGQEEGLEERRDVPFGEGQLIRLNDTEVEPLCHPSKKTTFPNVVRDR